MRNFLNISGSILLVCLAMPVNADEYYSDDIFTAIAEAKERTHHYDYSNATRYNRSTSQSIQIPRLLMRELVQTSIETPELADIEGQGSQKTSEPSVLNATSSNNSSQQNTNISSSSNLISNSASQGVSVRVYANN